MTPELYQLVVLKAGLKLSLLGLKPNRHWNRGAILKTVGKFTSGVYPNSRRGAERAIADIQSILESQK